MLLSQIFNVLAEKQRIHFSSQIVAIELLVANHHFFPSFHPLPLAAYSNSSSSSISMLHRLCILFNGYSLFTVCWTDKDIVAKLPANPIESKNKNGTTILATRSQHLELLFITTINKLQFSLERKLPTEQHGFNWNRCCRIFLFTLIV